MSTSPPDHAALIAEAEDALSRGRSRLAVSLLLGQFDNGLPHGPLSHRLTLTLVRAARQDGRSELAAQMCRLGLTRWRTNADILAELGLALWAMDQPAPAAEAWRAALAGNPDHPHALFGLAGTYDRQGQLEKARALLARLVQVAPTWAEAAQRLGNVLFRLGRLPNAARWLQQATDLDPTAPKPATDLGVVLRRLDRLPEAIAAHREALRRQPDFVEAEWNLANALLAGGEIGEGFGRYDARFAVGRVPRPDMGGRAQWDGRQPLAGRKLLLAAEQGVGDSLLALRFVGRLAAMGADITIQAHPGTEALLATVPGVSRVVPLNAPLPQDIDTALPIMSLPGRLGIGTEEVIACPPPYLSVPEGVPAPPEISPPEISGPEVSGPGPLVGLVWSGNPAFAENARRSLPPAALAPLMATVGARFVSLQMGDGPKPEGLTADWAPWLTDWGRSARALTELDLLITVDTGIANLAGALGLPAWVMLSTGPDWRWGAAGTSTPWYPRLRLFRQTTPGDWAPVVTAVAAAVTASLQSSASSFSK